MIGAFILSYAQVSFKDEVDVHEINPDDTSLGSKDFDENFDATADDSQVIFDRFIKCTGGKKNVTAHVTT